MFQPIRLLAALLGIIVIGAPLAAVGLFIIAVAGDPGTCEAEGRPIVFSDSAAASYQTAWDGFQATLDSGQAATVTFNETEVSSRAKQWLDERDSPITALRICFTEGGATASAELDVPFVPGDVDVLVHGTLILTGGQVEVDIDELEVGGLPGPLNDLVQSFVDDAIADETIDLELERDYQLAFSEGSVTVSGQP